MVQIKKHNTLYIKIITDNRGYITDLRENFTDFVEGYRFHPKYKAGQWNGRICMVEQGNILPYGLLFDVIKFTRSSYKDETLSIDQDVKDMFIGTEIEPDFSLNLFPRDYQISCITKCLRHKAGIIVSATASGKSCSIAYVIKTLMDNNLIKRVLIITPTISLVSQFFADLVEYGMDSSTIGKVYSKIKEFDKDIVISTWQTLIKNYDKLEDYDCVICDETHGASAFSIKTILSKCINAGYRFGFTGTMPQEKLANWNIKGFLGPILETCSAADLAEQGYIAKCNVDFMQINYKDTYRGDYNSVKDAIFTNPNRLSLIHKIIKNVDGNILVLVGKVESEGKLLKDYLDKCKLDDREIVFIWGDTSAENREMWRLELGKRKNIVLIATYQIFQVGINAPSLKYILFASPFKSRIRVLQSIGRALRLHEDKDFATIYDLSDEVPFLSDHSLKRLRYYISEKFNVNETTIDEKELLFF